MSAIQSVFRRIIWHGLIGWAGVCCISACAENGVIFQIGVPDGEYREFAIAGKYEDYAKQFPHDVDFVVGQSDAGRDWPYIQPGPDDDWAGNKPHTFTIHFQIPKPTRGYDRLAVDFVSAHYSDPPCLTIDINGERLERRLPAGRNDDALTNPKSGKKYSLQQLIPAALLRAGDNTIALTTAGGSWALYDDVRLESGVPAPKETLVVKAEPLPFFKRTPDGLRRSVKISIDNLENRGAPAELFWKSKAGSGSQNIDLHFGKNEWSILVPDVDKIELALRTAQREIKTPVQLPPTKKWLVFIVPTAHTDVGYTDLQERVRVRHANNGLRELEWLGRYPFLKWNSETYWQLNALLELHPDKTDEVFERLRQKRWGLSASYANMLTGLCSHEALNRYTLDAHNLARRGGFDLDSLILDDVPSAIGSLAMVMANSGIKYFIEGSNKDRAPHVGNGLKDPFYWEGVDGSRVLSFISYNPGYAVAGDLFHSMSQAMEKLPAYLGKFETTNYPYDAVVINGAYSDNREVEPWLPEAIEQWNAQWEYPKLMAALPGDFFGYIEKNFSNDIPVVKTDFGGWWEDGAASSALETVLDRRAEERVVAAEMLHSLSAVLASADYPKTNFDHVWHNILLYDEHTWGAAGSISSPNGEQTIKQWEVKSGFAREADAESRALLASGMDELAAMVPAADLVVFNSLAWSRNDLVKIESTGPVRDLATEKTLPCQALPEGGSCFIADDLPSIGYRSYRNATFDDSAAVKDAVQFSDNEMENEFYRVTLNPKSGGLQSIYDKQIKRELVDADSDCGLGELIYVSGGEGTYAVHSDLANLPPPKFEYHRQTGAGLKQINGPVFGEMTSQATAENFPGITMRVRLYHGLKRLDLIYELDKTETTAKEAVYLAFPFAVNASKGGLWLEYPDEITEPLKDQHASACHDWYSVQRWLAESDGDTTVELSPLDTPLVTLGQMTASTWPSKLSLKRGHVFAYVMNNYWHTNYKARQGGRFVFRFSLTSSRGGFSKHDAVIKGWDMFCPPVAVRGQGGRRPLFTSPAASLIGIEPAGLPLMAFKKAEDESGFVFRLCDFSGKGGKASLILPKNVANASGCNLVEADAQELKADGKTISVPVKMFSPVTVKVRFAP
jgi:alpha-mannosidase